MNATLAQPQSVGRADLDKGLGKAGGFGFLAAVLVAVGYVASSIYADASAAGVHATAILPFVLLFVALLVALGFEFVNGFHDTANAVATVIYTHSACHPLVAVDLVRHLQFPGRPDCPPARSPSAVVTLLPVELILQAGSHRRLRHDFCPPDRSHNLEPVAPGHFGLPNSSSSHTH